MTVEGKGMPKYHMTNSFGNLFIVFSIKFPSVLSKEEIEIIKEHFPELSKA